jgi:hypothetical protein
MRGRSVPALKQWKALIIAVVVALGVTVITFAPFGTNGRGVHVDRPIPNAAPQSFSREESAALFVGVRTFTKGTVEVPYAADDAVDLAWLFALDPRLNMVPPKRVVLALSGRPQKEESRRRLEELEQAGAKVAHADTNDILSLLSQQSALAGKNGILIFSLATHGFVQDGIPYIFGASSLFQYPETALPTTTLFDIAAKSNAARSLIFVDACRERLASKTRAGSVDPRTAAPPLDIARRMQGIAGQVVFFAAAAGQYAYDDEVNRNGVFTKAVIDGLHCKASRSQRITVATLQVYVERQVRQWIHLHREPSIAYATQVNIDGAAKEMPLACCRECGQPPAGLQLSRNGPVITLQRSDGTALWTHNLGAPVIQTELTDGDEVVAATRSKITIYSREGNLLATITDPLKLRQFKIAKLLRRETPHIVSLWSDKHASRLSIHNLEGELVSTYQQPDDLQYLAIGRPTARHTPKIVLAGAGTITILDPAKVARGKPLWRGRIPSLRGTIDRLEIVASGDSKAHNISIATAGGRTLLLDFAGRVVGRGSGS